MNCDSCGQRIASEQEAYRSGDRVKVDDDHPDAGLAGKHGTVIEDHGHVIEIEWDTPYQPPSGMTSDVTNVEPYWLERPRTAMKKARGIDAESVLRDWIRDNDIKYTPGGDSPKNIEEAARIIEQAEDDICVKGRFVPMNAIGGMPTQVCGRPENLRNLLEDMVREAGAHRSTNNLGLESVWVVDYDVPASVIVVGDHPRA